MDFPLFASRNWYLTPEGYVRAGKPVDGERFLHRILLHASVGDEVDHIDRNPLNNRRRNLRLATRVQQGHNRGMFANNTSGYKGVSFHRGKWQASIRNRGKLEYLGRFDTAEEAAAAYNARKKEVVP